MRLTCAGPGMRKKSAEKAPGFGSADERESGQSLVEFAVALPALLFLTLIVAQVALLVHAEHVVHYAAFCAARAAVVHDEPERARRAAALACLPLASPQPRGFEKTLLEFDLPRLEGLLDPSEIAECWLRYRSAYEKTDVQLEQKGNGDLTASVAHVYELTVPGIGPLAAQLLRLKDAPLGEEIEGAAARLGRPHVTIQALCTLPRESSGQGEDDD